MFKVTTTIDGVEVDDNNIESVLAANSRARLTRDVRANIEPRIGSMRCPLHGSAPDVELTALHGDTVTVHVHGTCCPEFDGMLDGVLNEERRARTGWDPISRTIEVADAAFRVSEPSGVTRDESGVTGAAFDVFALAGCTAVGRFEVLRVTGGELRAFGGWAHGVDLARVGTAWLTANASIRRAVVA